MLGLLLYKPLRSPAYYVGGAASWETWRRLSTTDQSGCLGRGLFSRRAGSPFSVCSGFPRFACPFVWAHPCTAVWGDGARLFGGLPRRGCLGSVRASIPRGAGVGGRVAGPPVAGGGVPWPLLLSCFLCAGLCVGVCVCGVFFCFVCVCVCECLTLFFLFLICRWAVFGDSGKSGHQRLISDRRVLRNVGQ